MPLKENNIIYPLSNSKQLGAHTVNYNICVRFQLILIQNSLVRDHYISKVIFLALKVVKCVLIEDGDCLNSQDFVFSFHSLDKMIYPYINELD